MILKRSNKLTLLLVACFIVTGCGIGIGRGYQPKTWTSEWLQAEDHNRRFYLLNGTVSFYPPAPILAKGTVFYDPLSFQHWKTLGQLTQLASTTGWEATIFQKRSTVSFKFHHFSHGLHGDLKVVDGGKRPPRSSLEAYNVNASYKKAVLGREQENDMRRQILSGTLEDHWQAELGKKTIKWMARNLWVRDHAIDELVEVSKMNDEQQAYHVKSTFMGYLKTKRARYKGLLDDTVVKVDVAGKPCVQVDKYERLNTPAAQYANSTAGGLGRDRSYTCIINSDYAVMIYVSMSMASGKRVDFDAMFKPLLDSIEWFPEKPAYLLKVNE